MRIEKVNKMKFMNEPHEPFKYPNFKARVQYNPPYIRKENIVEDGFFTVFTSKLGDIFSPEARERARSIENGLDLESRYFHTVV